MSTKKIVVSTGPDGRITALLEGSESEVLTSMSQGAQMSTDDFIKACERGFKTVVSLLVVELGATINVNCRNEKGVSGLLRASGSGQLEIIHILYQAKCCVTTTDNWDCNAAHYASQGGHDHVLKYLHGVGFQGFDHQNKRGQTPLHLACQHGHIMTARYLLIVHSADVTLLDKNGDAPLHLAFQTHLLIDYSELLNLLIHHGGNVNTGNARGETALHMAAQHDVVEAVECLLQKNADPSAVDKNGVSSIIAASVNGSVEVIPVLQKAGANVNSKDNSGRTPLHAACTEGHYDVVETLVNLNASQSSQDKGGNIPLQLVCQHGHLKIAKYLIDTGQSDVHSLDKNGQIPVHKACKGKDSKERSKLLQYLIEKGANIDLQSRYGRCPLHCTCEEGNPDAARILLEAEASVILTDRHGQTPLHYASYGGFSKFPTYNKVIELLLQHNADPNQPGEKRMTAVHIAAKRGNVEALKLLIHFSGHPNAICKDGRTAVHHAVIGDPPKAEPSYEAVKYLLENGGTPNEMDYIQGNTPTHYAAMEGHCDILRVLLQSGMDRFHFNKVHQLPEDVAKNSSVKNILRGPFLLVNLHLMTASVPEAFKFTSRKTWQTFVQLQKCTVFTTAGIESCEIQTIEQIKSERLLIIDVDEVAKIEWQYCAEDTIPLPIIKLFLTGHIKAGKTALRQHLGKSEGKPRQSLHQREEKLKERTAGIEIEHLEHDEFGSVVAYDLAGHCEYTTSHSVVIDCGSNSVFVILFDITGNLSEMKTQVNYWAAFIKAGRHKSSIPYVLLVATHRDQALASGNSVADIQRIYSCIFKELEVGYEQAFLITHEAFIINCLDSNSQEMNYLRKAIGDSCERIKKANPGVPTISLTLLKQLRNISNGEMMKAAMTVERVVEVIKQENKGLALREEAEPGLISSLLEYLSAMGMILQLQEWVIVDVEGVLGDVLSIIFAPNGFYTEDLSECKRGLLPLYRIESLFAQTFGTEIVVKILTELRLGVLLLDHSAIQVPALLRDIDMKARVWEDNNVYAQYAGFRFKLISKTDIFSPSSFPKFQVTMLQQYGSKVQLWTQGLCCIDNSVHVLIYMDEEKKFIDILLRSENLNEKACYCVRKGLRKAIKSELNESSAGTDYREQILRPSDLKCNRISESFIAYNLQEVQEHYDQHKTSITSDGRHRDSIQELLFCNYLEIKDTETGELTPQQLAIAAKELMAWKLVGTDIGLGQEVLEIIDVDIGNRSQEKAAHEMLRRAWEDNLLTNEAQLLMILVKREENVTLAWKLARLWDISCTL